jgi:hypothetical protein
MSGFEFAVGVYEKPGGRALSRALRETAVFTNGGNAVRHAELLSISYPDAFVMIEVKYVGARRPED